MAGQGQGFWRRDSEASTPGSEEWLLPNLQLVSEGAKAQSPQVGKLSWIL